MGKKKITKINKKQICREDTHEVLQIINWIDKMLKTHPRHALQVDLKVSFGPVPLEKDEVTKSITNDAKIDSTPKTEKGEGKHWIVLKKLFGVLTKIAGPFLAQV